MSEKEFEVVVAVVGDPEEAKKFNEGGLGYDFLPDEAFTMPYADRIKVAVRASGDDLLGVVLNQASEQLGIHPFGAFTAFYKPEDENVLSRRMSVVVPLVDDQGRVTWGHYFHEVRMADLVRSAEAGALDGDPLRPYLLLQPGIGNGILPDWQTIKAVWDAFDYVVAHIANIGGAGAAAYATKRAVIDRLRARSKAGAEVIEAQSDDWTSRNGQPYDLEEWLDDRAWLPEEVAPLLGCSDDQAVGVLWAFGFAKSPSGLWRRREDPEARLLNETMKFAITGYVHEASEEQVRSVIQDEVRHFLETGDAREIDWRRLEWLKLPGPVREKFMRVLSPLYHARAWLKGDR